MFFSKLNLWCTKYENCSYFGLIGSYFVVDKYLCYNHVQSEKNKVFKEYRELQKEEKKKEKAEEKKQQAAAKPDPNRTGGGLIGTGTTGRYAGGSAPDPVASLNDRSKHVLGSRLKADYAEKQEVKALLQTVKDQLADFILKHPHILGKDVVGSNIEGLILHRDDGAPVKVTTPEFKSQLATKMAQQREHELSESAGGHNVAICYGRWNPPQKGHRAAWETAAEFGTP